VTFNRCADLVDRVLSALVVILGLYALLGVGCALVSGFAIWSVALALCIIGVGLRRWGRVVGEFQLLLVYATACLLAFTVWSQVTEIIPGMAVKRLGDALLLAAAPLVALKLLFRRAGEFFLGTADFLALALMVFLAIAAQQPAFLGMSLGGPVLRAILIMLAARTVASRGPASHRLLVNLSLVLSGVFALAGFL
jgi:hypothetical protein